MTDTIAEDLKDETDPIERLRYFCSCGLSGADWLGVEPYFEAVTAERDALRAALREAYEVYAGMEGFVPSGAPEVYQRRIIDQMVAILSAALAAPQTGVAPMAKKPAVCLGFPTGNGCTNPAGGHKWSPYFCLECEKRRHTHITAQLDALKERLSVPTTVQQETP